MSNQGKDDDIAESITQYQLAEHIMKTTSETNALVKMLFKNSSEQKSTKHAAITYEQAENIIKSTHETNALMKRILAQTVPSSRKKLRFDDDSETNNTTTHDNFTKKSDDDPTDNDFISNATSSPAKPPFKPKNHLKQDISARKTSSPTQHDIQLDIISAATSSPPQHEDLVLSTHNKSKKVLHVVDCKDNELEVIDTVGFWTLEYHVSGSKLVSLFVPTPATWIREYVNTASPMHEPTNMTDCMVQIMTRLINHYTTTSSIFVVPFALSIEKSMTRENVCLHFQKHTIMLSDTTILANKTHGVAVIIMDGDFGVVLYHIGQEKNGNYHPTISLLCSHIGTGREYCIAGVADYFTIMFGVCNKSFRSDYRIHTFNDICGDINAYHPWSFELFQGSNTAFTNGSHMMTIKLVLSFVCAFYDKNEILNNFNSDLIGWRSMYDNRHPEVALRFHTSKICYEMMIQAILENLYKPVRDDIGQRCSHLDPLNTCQTIRVMITHFVNEMKGKNQLFLVVCTEKILTYALLLFVFTRECDRKKKSFYLETSQGDKYSWS